MLLLVITISLYFHKFSQAETLKIGAIFDTDDPIKERAFHHAIHQIEPIHGRTIEGLVKNVPPNDPFEAMLAACHLIESGAVAILGPTTHENAHMVQTVCDNKDIPLLDVRSVAHPQNSINFYPLQQILTQIYIKLLEAWNFENFVILYENDDSLIRLAELLKFYGNGHRMVVRQLDKYQNGNYRPTLKEVWRSGATHFVLDCSTDILEEVLHQAQQVGLVTNKQFYIITNLDFHTLDLTSFQYSETNITGMRFIDPDSDEIQNLGLTLYRNDFTNTEFGFIEAWKVNLEMALIIDAVTMFGEVLNRLPKDFAIPSIDCASDKAWTYGTTLTNLVKSVKYPGYTGLIQFDNFGLRSAFGLEIIELKEGGIIKIGNWNYSDGLNINRVYPPDPPPLVEGSLVNRTFIVITCLTEPYGMRRDSEVPLYGNERYEGFGIDLIAELSKKLGFNYTFIIREDKKNGEFDESSGEWTGMIGDVISGKADLAITDLTITSERESAVDFSTTFMSLGISILYQKPKKALPSFFSFADPFSLTVWKLLAAAFFGASIALFILGRISPSEWQNPYPCVEDEFLVNQLSLRNCVWFMVGSLMQQGSEIAPIAFSTRMVAGMWWFFTLIMVSSYTANLAAFLTTESPDLPFKDVFELVQVAEKKGIKFGAKINGSTEKFFLDSKHVDEYQQIYKYMKNHEDEVMVNDNKDGVHKAEHEDYAFFMETTSIEYETQRRCGLTSVGHSLDEKGYGIAMRKNSSYRMALSTAILKLQEEGVLAKLKRKWWEEQRGGGLCPQGEKSTEGTPLNLKNVEGVFCVTIIGTVLSCVLVFVEMAVHTFKKSLRVKKPFKVLLMDEMRFYFRTSAMLKPSVKSRKRKNRLVPCLSTMRCLGLTVFLLIFPNFLGQEQDRKEIFLGGIFTEPPDVDDSVLSDEEAFNFAIDIANREYSDVKFTSVSEESDLRTNGPFDSRLQACSLVNQQALVIFGPKNAEEIDIVQSICDNKDLAHVITRWVYSSADFRSVINFYPHSAYLTSAYFSVLKLWNWKTLTVFYEDNESMLRLGDLLNLAKNEGIIVTVKQLYEGLDETPIYRTTLKEAVRSGQKNFIIDCKIESLEEVLKQAQQVGLMTKDYNFFITNLDLQTINLEPFQYSEANITGIRILDPLNEMFHVKAGAIMRQKPNFNLTKMRTETALLIDAVSVITQVISRKLSIKEMEMTEISCNSPKSSRHGYTIANHVKTSKFDEMTGRIEFDGNGVRSNFDLDVIELTQNGISKIGTWNMSKGLVITPHKDEDIVEDPLSLRNKTFKVITCLTDPYCMLKENSGQLFGNDRFEGFAIDLIHELAQMEGFNYTFIIREDKSNGDKNKVTGEWSGMIGDVMHGVADLAITDLTITAEREEAVDFTSPFMNLGISILAKKPGNAPPSFFSFADPFALDTWIMLALAYIAVSVSFFVLGRICPDEWTNPYPCVEEPEFLINQFSLSNSFWYAVGSLMQQGTELAPIGVPTRMVAGMWWFFVLIMVSSYTASLAAFLANENTITLFTDVESLVQNYEEKGIRMGAKRKGATEGFFRGKDSETYKIIAKYMEEHPDDMVGDNKDGVKLANKETYAFFMESISIEYETQRHCDLQQYGGLLDDKGYGIAMRKNSTYRKTLSTAILKLQSSGQLDNLKRTWWEEKRGGGQCLDSGDDATPALDVRNVEGVFYVTIGGTLCAIVLIFFELFLSLLKISKKYKISMREALNNEKKAFLDFNSNVKPAPKAKSKSGSKSSGESGKSNNNTGAPTYGFIPTITKDTLDE
ncbi:hypothetical protein TcasGA2_TC031399 [Tribolium castaneum]|uniref:Glutamate receptor ionotropic, kainate 2-like Protein n=3 Tax=Tribolium castaneum TaxID=7070 RepID=A0A139WAU0_TRICA|nr:hypothetical protein TcasGA2_TC031399 [Tribolium castaneum]